MSVVVKYTFVKSVKSVLATEPRLAVLVVKFEPCIEENVCLIFYKPSIKDWIFCVILINRFYLARLVTIILLDKTPLSS